MRSPELNYELPKPSKIRASQQPTYLTHAESSPLSSILVPCAGIRQPSNEHQTTAHRGAARELFCGSVYGVLTGFLVILVAKNIAAILCFLLGKTLLKGYVVKLAASNNLFK